MGSSSVGTATMPAKEQPGLLNILEFTQVTEAAEKAFLWGQERGLGGQVDLYIPSSGCLKMKVEIRFE